MVLDNALMALREPPATLVLLGDTYTDLARFEEAARAYRQALTINSRSRFCVERARACVDTARALCRGGGGGGAGGEGFAKVGGVYS